MSEQQQSNYDAWGYLDQALFTSSHVKAKDIEMGSTEWDNVYPTSLEEADQMEALIQKAEEVAEDPREEKFSERVRELKEVVYYSRHRHRTWKWTLILGSILGACLFWYFSNQDQINAERKMADVYRVEAWKACDTTVAYQKLDTVVGSEYVDYYASANVYKSHWLKYYNEQAESSRKMAERYQHSLDTATTDKSRESFKKLAEESKASYEKNKELFNTLAAKKFKDVQEEAKAKAQGSVEASKSDSNTKIGWMIYLIILIPLYIITGYSYGYMITRHRRQAKIMRGLQKVGFALAAAFFGVGLAMKLLPDDIVKYQYSSGRTETRREANTGNFAVIAFKFVLMAVGIVIYCFISALIMTIETITGLMRNFNWQKILNKKAQSPVE